MGAETILAKINENTDREVALVRSQSAEKSKLSCRKIAETASAQAGEILAKADRESESLLARESLMAGLEVRKNTLAAKRALLDRAFDEALGALCSFEGERWETLMEKIILSAAETGDEVLKVNAADLEKCRGAFLDRVNKALKEKGLLGELTLSDQPVSIRGGAILSGEKYDIDGSFEELLKDCRERDEGEVSSRLFARTGW